MTRHQGRGGIQPWVILISSTLLLCSLEAREIHVRGDALQSREDGEVSHPYRSITKAVQVAKPGDTVMVHPVAGGYRETVSLIGLEGGKPGNPILIDGQGSQLVGSDRLSTEGWKFDEQSGLHERGDCFYRMRSKLCTPGEYGSVRFSGDLPDRRGELGVCLGKHRCVPGNVTSREAARPLGGTGPEGFARIEYRLGIRPGKAGFLSAKKSLI